MEVLDFKLKITLEPNSGRILILKSIKKTSRMMICTTNSNRIVATKWEE